MNNQQKAQAHKSEYKSKARRRRFIKYLERQGPGGLVIDLPERTTANWEVSTFAKAIEKSANLAAMHNACDKLTNGLFSEYFNERKER